MKIKAAVLRQFGQLEIEDIDLPLLKAGQALIQIHYAAICGSQINEYMGHKGHDKYLPHLMGHEAIGVVLDTHKSVTKIQPGDIVICTWIKTSGIHGGPITYKNINAGPISTFANQTIISEDRLVKVLCNISPSYSLMGCVVPTSLGVVWKEGVRPNALVIGVGAIGLGIILSYSMPKNHIYFIETNPHRLHIAQTYSTNYIKCSQPPLIDIIFNCTNSIKSINESMKYLNTNGKLVVIGNPNPKSTISINPYDLIYGKKICGYSGNEFPNPDKNFLILCQQRNFIHKYSKIIGKQFNLEDINKAFTSMQNGEGKAIIKCQP